MCFSGDTRRDTEVEFQAQKNRRSGRFFCIQGALSGTLRSLFGARGRLELCHMGLVYIGYEFLFVGFYSQSYSHFNLWPFSARLQILGIVIPCTVFGGAHRYSSMALGSQLWGFYRKPERLLAVGIHQGIHGDRCWAIFTHSYSPVDTSAKRLWMSSESSGERFYSSMETLPGLVRLPSLSL